MAKENRVRDRSYHLALGAVRLYRDLLKQREYVVSRQMVRAATSVGANVEEALAGQSRRDFAAKMTIASKEARETLYWLRLLRDSELIEAGDVEPLIRVADEVVRLLTAIVKSTRESFSAEASRLPPA